MNQPIATAWASVASWAVRQGAVEFNKMKEPWRGETDEWEVGINGAMEEREGIPPLGIELKHKRSLCFAVLGPFEGAIGGGITEEEIIEHFGDPEKLN